MLLSEHQQLWVRNSFHTVSRSSGVAVGERTNNFEHSVHRQAYGLSKSTKLSFNSRCINCIF